jgi:hypothetical protein
MIIVIKPIGTRRVRAIYTPELGCLQVEVFKDVALGGAFAPAAGFCRLAGLQRE